MVQPLIPGDLMNRVTLCFSIEGKNPYIRIFFFSSIFLIFSFLVCSCGSTSSSNPDAFLTKVYGEHLYQNELGEYYCLLWPDNIELGLVDLDRTDQKIDTSGNSFVLLPGKRQFYQGEPLTLILQAKVEGTTSKRYEIQQKIGDRWYLLNGMTDCNASAYIMIPDEKIEIQVDNLCGSMDQSGNYHYPLPSGKYRIVVSVSVKPDAEASELWQELNVACMINVK